MKDLEAQTGVSREAIHLYLREGLLASFDYDSLAAAGDLVA